MDERKQTIAEGGKTPAYWYALVERCLAQWRADRRAAYHKMLDEYGSARQGGGGTSWAAGVECVSNE